jgi:quercetin dioxygenase-like cupin family protein
MGEDSRPLANPVGGSILPRLRAGRTDGSLTLLETVAAPGEGPPLHVHASEDETLYVLSGTFRFRVADALDEGPEGTLSYVRRGTAHTWQNIGAEPGRMLVLFTPASPGMEQFFEAFSARAAEGPKAFAELAGPAGMTVTGPPLAVSHPREPTAG